MMNKYLVTIWYKKYFKTFYTKFIAMPSYYKKDSYRMLRICFFDFIYLLCSSRRENISGDMNGFETINTNAKKLFRTLLTWLAGGVTGCDKFDLNACIER